MTPDEVMRLDASLEILLRQGEAAVIAPVTRRPPARNARRSTRAGGGSSFRSLSVMVAGVRYTP